MQRVRAAGWLKATLLVALCGLSAALAAGVQLRSASAQSCNTDSDCTRGLALGANANCIGDTLITRRTRCMLGRCETRETGRRSCRVTGRGRCVGGSYQIETGRCDAMNGTCATRTERVPCARGCVCRDNILVVHTGECSPAIGCHKGVRKCPGGCSCDPEPVCREEKDGKAPDGKSGGKTVR